MAKTLPFEVRLSIATSGHLDADALHARDKVLCLEADFNPHEVYWVVNRSGAFMPVADATALRDALATDLPIDVPCAAWELHTAEPAVLRVFSLRATIATVLVEAQEVPDGLPRMHHYDVNRAALRDALTKCIDHLATVTEAVSA